MALSFSISATDGAARTGTATTAHGSFQTPAFMAVGTAATVKALRPEDIAHTGTEIVLANTYHLMLRPGEALIRDMGGLHAFMNWPGPILTDSGGFQVMSLAKLRKITEEGVAFQSHIDGARHLLTPERSMEIQLALGADIIMAFDECTPFPATADEARESMELSMRWAARSLAAFDAAGEAAQARSLFGIVQGGVYADLRARSVEALRELGFPGYAIGGLAVGEGQAAMFEVLDHTIPRLPTTAPRYLMGIGKPDDIVGAVCRGIDMFDCVLPTRSGRTGQAFTADGPLNFKNARFRDDADPIAPGCRCRACVGHSRAYMHHLIRSDEILGPMLLTEHNLTFYQDLMANLRSAIGDGRLADFAEQFTARYRAGKAGGSAEG